ncbi:MAG: lytic transglycosylase domain-containing protein [Salinibacterium sp.]|nr:lytic transglycosylase domain-containing protein [Salinibacterium sp.]
MTIAPPVPTSPAWAVAPSPIREGQTLAVEGDYANPTGRDAFTISDPVAVAASTAPAAGVPDAGSAQAIAYAMVKSMGLDDSEYNCLVALWNRESHWNVYAFNESSGAYGIPQALPGEKMASAGADWATNATTQVTWGLSYIAGRYGTPCGAWAHSEDQGWY